MKKRTYKRMKNMLYREIKRRIFAEKRADNLIINQQKMVHVHRDIETLKARKIIPDYIEQTKEYLEDAKSEMARQMAQKLIADGYLKFTYDGEYVRIAEDEEVMHIKEIMAKIHVVKPWD